MDSETICLFDVDGTLTKPRQNISGDVADFLVELKKRVVVGLVGGSDLCKIAEQMAGSKDEVVQQFKYVFSENGLVAHKDGSLIHEGNIAEYMGEEKLQEFINYTLRRLSELTLPCKRGVFIEFRSGLINVCPVGRSCTQAERDQFSEYDKKHGLRESLVKEFKEKFSDMGLHFSIGGQISFDVFPEGWDKRYCLQYLKKDGIKNIHFFGDKTSPGGNDHEIFADPGTVGHTVTSPEDTMQQVTKLFL